MTRAAGFSMLLTAMVVCLAHWASFDGVFFFDDEDAIVFNSHLETFGLGAPAQSPVAGRPLVGLSLSLNYALGGLEPWGYHCFNLVVHLLNAWLVGFLLSQVFATWVSRPRLLATLAACLWAVHPIQSEVVAYTIQRTESLAVLFMLLSLAAMTLGVERRRPGWLGVAVVTGAMGLGAKESAAVLPILSLLFDRGVLAESWSEVWQRRRWFHGAMFGTWVIAAWIVAQGFRSESIGFDLGVSSWEYLECQALALADYARVVIWPVAQTIDYGVARPVDFSRVWGVGTLVILAVVGSIIAFVRWPRVGLWGVWIFVCLGPTSTLVPIVTEVAAERRMYLAMVGVVVLFAFGLSRCFDRRGRAFVAVPVLVALVGLCSWLTFEREQLYRDAAELWADAAAERPQNERAHGNLGAVLAARGELAAARGPLEEAVRLDPTYSDSRLYLGIILASQGEFLPAANHLRWAEEHHPRTSLAAYWAGIAHERLRGYRSAIRYYDVVLLREPDNPSARNNLAWLLATCPEPSLRDPARAYAVIEPAYRAQPQVGELRDTFAACLAANGRFDLAIPIARALLDDAQRLAAQTSQAADRDLVRMLAERLESYRRSEVWIDRPGRGVPRFQGRLRNLQPSL